MTEVLCDNFTELLPAIKDAINESKFIAIDTEFTALYLDDDNKPSLFDTPAERYAKLRRTVKHAVPIQIGLSAFNFDPSRNVYQAHTFIFYVWPKPMMSINTPLKIQPSTFQFLNRYKFDYNKLIYRGIPFLNRDEQAKVYTDLQGHNKNDKKWMLYGSIDQYMEDIMKDATKFWEGKEDVLVIESTKDFLQHDYEGWYYVQHQLRQKFIEGKKLWTEIDENNQLVLRKVTTEEYARLDAQNKLIETIVTPAMGFTHVYNELVKSKKPIIGHNMLMDVLLLQNTFGEYLSESYKKFKAKLHADFPCLVDTKCQSFAMRKTLPKEAEWTKSSLQDLYKYFLDGRGRRLSFNTPLIKPDLVLEKNCDHNAGWDSYCTGFVFVHMAHYRAAQNLGVKSHKGRTITSSEHFLATQDVQNKINLIRAHVTHVNVPGSDPTSTRPPWLVAISRKQELDTIEVFSALSKYGFVEIEEIHNGRAVIAVSSWGTAKEILKSFKHEDFTIKTYYSLLHGKYADSAHKIVGFLATVGVLYLCHRRIWLF